MNLDLPNRFFEYDGFNHVREVYNGPADPPLPLGIEIRSEAAVLPSSHDMSRMVILICRDYAGPLGEGHLIGTVFVERSPYKGYRISGRFNDSLGAHYYKLKEDAVLGAVNLLRSYAAAVALGFSDSIYAFAEMQRWEQDDA